jgi:uncharacterized protein YihD (DUF1040 family)
MKNPNRIIRIMDKFSRLWRDNPDLRFCQLLLNITKHNSIFYLEDDKLEELLNKFINEVKNV